MADASAAGRGVALVEADGRRVGAIVYDATLIADPAPVAEAAQVIALALDRERLTAELLASRDGLRRSRADGGGRRRRAAAGSRATSTTACRAARAAGAARPRAVAARRQRPWRRAPRRRAAARQLQEALAKLRELVQGVLPAALVERGLGAAADDLADRMPLPTTVTAGDERSPPAVESAGWFVIAEALRERGPPRARATLAVRVECAGGSLLIEVADDGVGGAAHGRGRGGGGDGEGGPGLRGLADRLDVLGGQLRVESPRRRRHADRRGGPVRVVIGEDEGR